MTSAITDIFLFFSNHENAGIAQNKKE